MVVSANRLAVYLRDHKLSHRAFAAKAGMAHLYPMVSLWTRGLARPGLDAAVAIEKATNGAVPVEFWQTVRSGRRIRRARLATESA